MSETGRFFRDNNLVVDDAGRYFQRQPNGELTPWKQDSPFQGAKQFIEDLPEVSNYPLPPNEGEKVMGFIWEGLKGVAGGLIGLADTSAAAARGDPTAALDPLDVVNAGVGIGAGVSAAEASLGVFGSRIPIRGRVLSKGSRGHTYHETDDSVGRIKQVPFAPSTNPTHQSWVFDDTPLREAQLINADGTAIRQEMYLPEVLDNPELFDLYPELTKFKVRYEPDLELETFAAYDDNTTITIGPRAMMNKDELYASILHEVQHGVQKLDNDDFRLGATEDAARVHGTRPTGTNPFDAAHNATALWNTLNDIKMAGGDLPPHLRDAFEELEKGMVDTEIYMREPGEIEAMQAARRAYYTKSERESNPPTFTSTEYNKYLNGPPEKVWSFDMDKMKYEAQRLYLNTIRDQEEGVAFGGQASQAAFPTFGKRTKGPQQSRDLSVIDAEPRRSFVDAYNSSSPETQAAFRQFATEARHKRSTRQLLLTDEELVLVSQWQRAGLAEADKASRGVLPPEAFDDLLHK